MFISDLNAIYSRSTSVDKLIELTTAAPSKLHLRGLVGSGCALVAYATMQKTGGVHLFMLPDKEEAAYMLNDLENAAGKTPGEENTSGKLPIDLYFFPRSARQAYEVEQTDNANVAMRTEVLNDLRKNLNKEQKGKPICIITYPEAIAEKVITEHELGGSTFEIIQGNTLDIDFVDEWMHTYGFEKVDYVYEPGQYAVRGGIIDIFSFSFDHPYRIELFGNEVESIRKFEPDTQLSVAKMTKATIVPNVSMRNTEEARITMLEFMPASTRIWIKDTEGALNRMDVEIEKAQKQYEKQAGLFERMEPHLLYATKQELFELLLQRRVIEFG